MISNTVPRFAGVLSIPSAFNTSPNAFASLISSNPLGSSPVMGLLPTVRYRFTSPAVNPMGSMFAHRPSPG
jgi:hypothetical protein